MHAAGFVTRFERCGDAFKQLVTELRQPYAGGIEPTVAHTSLWDAGKVAQLPSLAGTGVGMSEQGFDAN